MLLALSLVLVVAGLAVIGRLAFRLAGEVRHFGRAAGDAHDRIGRAAEDLRDAVDPYDYGDTPIPNTGECRTPTRRVAPAVRAPGPAPPPGAGPPRHSDGART
ncbi:hypothetical protein ACU686_00850 [Yinghuangia aomiensis]